MLHDGKDPSDLSGKATSCDFSSVTVSLINLQAYTRLYTALAEMGPDGQIGTTNVPLVKVLAACRMIQGIKYGGGHTQLTSHPQSHVKVSIASVPGHQNRELNWGNWVLRLFKNLSIMCGPHCRSIVANVAG